MAAVVRLADVCTHRKQPLINIKEYSEPLWSGGRYESASLDRKLGRNVAYKRICKLLVFGARGKVQHDHFLFFFIIIIIIITTAPFWTLYPYVWNVAYR